MTHTSSTLCVPQCCGQRHTQHSLSPKRRCVNQHQSRVVRSVRDSELVRRAIVVLRMCWARNVGATVLSIATVQPFCCPNVSHESRSPWRLPGVLARSL